MHDFKGQTSKRGMLSWTQGTKPLDLEVIALQQGQGTEGTSLSASPMEIMLMHFEAGHSTQLSNAAVHSWGSTPRKVPQSFIQQHNNSTQQPNTDPCQRFDLGAWILSFNMIWGLRMPEAQSFLRCVMPICVLQLRSSGVQPDDSYDGLLLAGHLRAH